MDTNRGVKAQTLTQERDKTSQPYLFEDRPDPCTIVILGASGDLTARKLVPALYNLFLKRTLPDPFLIIGSGRTEMDDVEFRNKLKKGLAETGEPDMSRWKDFASLLCYRKVLYDDLSSFTALSDQLQDLEKQIPTGGNRIFYFAIPPHLYKTTAQMLGRAGLAKGRRQRKGWSKIVVEKPFGRDLDTAVDLDHALHEHFKEHQIYRIDHYLAKETVQNILMFRFANSIFEPVWNRRYIENIRITAAETLGVGSRAGYYEDTGVVRDMFQNHMMQLLALTAMEPPSIFEAERVRDEKAKVYRCLRPFPVDALQEHIVLGQYGAGSVEEKSVPAYRDEPGVMKDSLTPTFAMMKIFLDNWRWQGVPFFLTSGKRMAKKITEIVIQFKGVPHSMFRQTFGEGITANRLILAIYPDERITLTFQTKTPGAKVVLRSVTMDFRYDQGYTGPALEAYEKVLLDCMLGDHMLFWRQDSVELCWAFLTPILRTCETCGDREAMLMTYDAGSSGPDRVQALLR